MKNEIYDMWLIENKVVKDLFFKQTCVIAPEQYDVFLKDKLVAYVRCRNGHLVVRPMKRIIEIKDVRNMSDEEYSALELYDLIDWCKIIYEVVFENRYKSDIPKDEFENMANAILSHLETTKAS